MTLNEAKETRDAKAKEITAIYAEAGEDYDFSKVKSLDGDTKAKVEHVQSLNTELADLQDEVSEKVKHDAAAKRARDFSTTIGKQDGLVEPKKDDKPEIKTLGRAFIESKAGGELKGQEVRAPDVEVKTLMTAAAGWDPDNVRSDRLAAYAVQAVGLLDFIPMGSVNSDLYKYMKESTFTNNAAEASEGGQFGEAALAYTETSDEVEKVAVWLPVTDEQLEDVAGLESLINLRLSYMLKARLESQILVGDGSTPNLLGTLNISSIQTQAKGSDSVPDALYKAVTKARVTGFAEPSNMVMHPNDWQGIRLLTTADGIYIFGSPADPGINRLWGLPVALTTFETENTAIVGGYNAHSMLFMRRGVTFKVSDSHSDYFIKGKQAIRADFRCVMVHFRDEAFVQVTGI